MKAKAKKGVQKRTTISLDKVIETITKSVPKSSLSRPLKFQPQILSAYAEKPCTKSPEKPI